MLGKTEKNADTKNPTQKKIEHMPLPSTEPLDLLMFTATPVLLQVEGNLQRMTF